MVDGFTKWVNSLTAAAPKGAEMRELHRQHDEWLRTAQTGRPYWGADAHYVWRGPEYAIELYCVHQVTFDDRGRDRLYAPNGVDSLALWHQWGGLTTDEPPRPPRPSVPHIEGDLRDWEHPERWTVKAVQL